MPTTSRRSRPSGVSALRRDDEVRPDRDEDVERDLGRERPGLQQRAERVPGEVDVHEAVVEDERLERRDRLVGERVDDDGQHDPVRRVDPQEAAPQERAGGGRGSVVQVGEDERPVEQEAGEHEEDCDAAVHAGEERTEDVRAVRAAGERDVDQHDGERGERAQPVEAREMAVGGGVLGP